MIERCYKTLSLPVLFLPLAVTRLLAEIQGNKEATGTAWLSIKVSFPLVIALLSILPDPRYEKYNGSSNHSKSQVPNNQSSQLSAVRECGKDWHYILSNIVLN